MRLFLVLFLASWVVGIASGVTGWVLLAGAGAVLLFNLTRRAQLSWPHVLAGLMLLGLGWVWGESFIGTDTAQCDFPEEFLVTVDEVYRIRERDVQYVIQAGSCQVLVTADRFPALKEGDMLELSGEVELTSEIPDEYAGYGKYLTRRGIVATMRYPEVTLPLSEGEQAANNGGPPDWREGVYAVSGIREVLRQRVGEVFGEPEGSVVLAMALGQRGSIPQEVTENFRRTGVSHILAISGLHVSLIAGGIVMLSLLLPLPSVVRAAVSLAVLWGYVWLIGFPVSAARAAIFWTLVMAALELKWLISLATVVLTAAAVMVSVHPLILFDAGFQLSFAAVVGIGLILFLTKRGDMFSDVKKHPVMSLAMVSLGATLTTWPITAYTFGGVPVYSVLVNLLVVPPVPLFLGTAIVSTLASFVVFPLAQAGSFLVHILWEWTDWVTRTAAVWPGAYIEVEALPLWVVWVYYAGLVWAANWVLTKQGRRWREVWE